MRWSPSVGFVTQAFVAFDFHNGAVKVLVNALFETRSVVIGLVLKAGFFNEILIELFKGFELAPLLAQIPQSLIGFAQLHVLRVVQEIRKLVPLDNAQQLLKLCLGVFASVWVSQLGQLDLKDRYLVKQLGDSDGNLNEHGVKSPRVIF
jgi:hypothetical protein